MADQARSLAAALKLTPEVESFISGQAVPAKRISGIAEKKAEAKNTSEATKSSGADESAKRTTRPERKGEQAKTRPKTHAVPICEARVAVTTRFRQATAEALRRLSLERKLRGQQPWSQQEIIESAVNHWLKTESKN